MSTIKFLHAADLHLDSAFESLPPAAAAARRASARKIPAALADAAVSHGAEAIFLSGDIFESKEVSRETQEAFCAALAHAEVPVFIAPGNHDPYSPDSVWAHLELPENVRVFKGEAITSTELPELNARIWGAGFERAFCPPLLTNFTPPEKIFGILDIMVLHAALTSGRGDYCPVTRRELERSGMDYVALGHIHMGTGLTFAGKTAYAYPGCTEGRGYDELGAKGCLLVTLSEEGATAEFIPLYTYKYENITVDVSDAEPLDAVRAATINLSSTDYVRLALEGETDSPPNLPALRRELENRFAELSLRDETVRRRNVWDALNAPGLTGLFLQKLKTKFDAARGDDERDRIELAARYGLNALEGGRLE
ncbi:MAG: metallophosphoesterase [Oscillospiraceae bacterium]|jgi:DNA repair exonuclease SbcCD nuclease subunit|nr:metallophosphoesterase [Oscillospiraceae bacterium]